VSKPTRLAAAAVPLLFAVGAAHADPNTDTNAETYITPRGPYVGIGWGHFDLRLDNLDQVDQAVNNIVHSGDDAWKVNLGYRFSPYFSIEGDYVDFGHPSDTFQGTGSNGNYQLHMSGFAPFAVATLPLGAAEVFGKAGWLWYNSDLRVNLNSPGQELLQSSSSRSNFIWGGGVGVTVFRHLNLNAEYDQVRLDNASHSNVLWLATAWRF
jgi:opacity protein-like surface antigen